MDKLKAVGAIVKPALERALSADEAESLIQMI
jgi:hypothetical protein